LPKLGKFIFFDAMATPDDIETMKNIRIFDEEFEVGEDGQPDEARMVTPFVRSNQGKE
jgi:hypothetical protein